MPRLAIAALTMWLAGAGAASALEIQIKEVRTVSSLVHATLELRDLVPERFKGHLEENRPLHLRVQAELWESRPVWDRLVYPAILKVVRMTKSTLPPSPYAVAVDLGNRDRVSASGRYYVHVVATLGTLAEREVDEVGDAVFGRPEETNGLGSLGRAVFRAALQISDYLQSVSAEARTKKLDGKDLLRP